MLVDRDKVDLLFMIDNIGPGAIVTSICLKVMDALNANHGYDPAMLAIVERMKESLY